MKRCKQKTISVLCDISKSQEIVPLRSVQRASVFEFSKRKQPQSAGGVKDIAFGI